jgi:hypothetical protein
MKLIPFLPLLLASFAVATAWNCHHATEPPINQVDTTSHNISWQVDMLGDGNSSLLYDVAILSDTLVYAVGEIYKVDSSGHSYDPRPYNLIRWNGTRWDLERVTVHSYYGWVTPVLTGIIAFSPDDVWTVGTDPYHFNGTAWEDFDIRRLLSDDSLTVSRGWGSSSTGMYFGGHWGNLIHYDGTHWQKLSSGTKMEILDIYGAPSGQGANYEILALACDPYSSPDHRMLQLIGQTVLTLPQSGITEPLNTLWFVPGKQYYAAGSGVYQKNTLADATWRNQPHDITIYYTEAVRGTGTNDVFLVGNVGDIMHFNGNIWHSYQPQTQLHPGYYRSVAVKGDQIFAVGGTASLAAVARGRRVE